jgi:hypothetical protein
LFFSQFGFHNVHLFGQIIVTWAQIVNRAGQFAHKKFSLHENVQKIAARELLVKRLFKGVHIMATNTTPFLGLSQWVAEDSFLREDFNRDNLAIDTALSVGLQAVSGTYTGTGKYAQSNSNVLTFDFVPKIIFICLQSSTAGQAGIIICGAEHPPAFDPQDSSYPVSRMNVEYSNGGKTVSWYHVSSATKQLNTSGYVYQYLAIG